jgi:toluene monooxygenase system ferredoxin subunit
MNWKRVCAVDDLTANSLKKFTVDGISLIVVNLGDALKAFPPLCPHMEEPLAESGVCDNKGKLTCIKHLWNWDLRTGAPEGETERALLMYDIKLDGADVLVNLERELTYEYDEDNAGGDDDDFFKS